MEADTNNTYTTEDISEAVEVYNNTLDSLQSELNQFTKL
jgi:hypothetical protein